MSNYNKYVWPPQTRNSGKKKKKNRNFHSDYSPNSHGYHVRPNWVQPTEQWHLNYGMPRPNFINQRGDVFEDRYRWQSSNYQPSQSAQNYRSTADNTVLNGNKKLNYTKSIEFVAKPNETEPVHDDDIRFGGSLPLDEEQHKNESYCKMESENSLPKSTTTLRDVSMTQDETHSGNAPARNLMHRGHTKRLIEGLSQPVQAGVAERMMQKMGWKGGSLGARGDGIQEPIMPNIFMMDKKGFDSPGPKENKTKPLDKKLTLKQPLIKNKQRQGCQPNQKAQKTQPMANLPPKKSKKASRRSVHKARRKARKDEVKYQTQTKALQEILEFVRDESQDSMSFSKENSKIERASIHQLVAMIREEAFEDFEDHQFCEENIEAITEIRNTGCCLYTESVGKFPLRSLHLYKELPAHIYLITPEDLRYNNEDESEENINSDYTENNANTIKTEIVNNSGCSIETNKSESATKNSIEINNSCGKANYEETKEINISNTVNAAASDNIDNDSKTEDTPDDKEIIDKYVGKESNREDNVEASDATSIVTYDQEQLKLDNINKVTENETQNSDEQDETCLEYNDIRYLLFTFLKEFYDNEVYTEMKFRGPFNETEVKAINDFTSDIVKCTDLAEYCDVIPEIEKNGLKEYLTTSKLAIEGGSVAPNHHQRYVYMGRTLKSFKKTSRQESAMDECSTDYVNIYENITEGK